jgi:LysM repeat protein
MFAVLNKDVKSSAYLSVLVCFLIIPLLVNARDLESLHTDADSQYTNNDIHGSYEDYITDRSSRIEKTELRTIKNKNCHNKSKSSAHKKVTSTGKKNIFVNYTVKKKDTLTKIAKKFNITVSVILKHNRLNDQHTIRSGMVLKIPKDATAQYATNSLNDSLYEIKGPKPRFKWPVPRVVEYKNDGLDGVKPIGIIITSVPGSKVLSSAPGMVKKIGSMRGFGKYIVINHAGRFNTVYSNLSEILVTEGHSVQSGIIIGRIHSSEKKLHFQIDLEGKPENPLKYLPKNI